MAENSVDVTDVNNEIMSCEYLNCSSFFIFLIAL